MTNGGQAPIPGWKAGKGHLMAGLKLTVVQLGELLNVPVQADHEARYFWFENEATGRMTSRQRHASNSSVLVELGSSPF